MLMWPVFTLLILTQRLGVNMNDMIVAVMII